MLVRSRKNEEIIKIGNNVEVRIVGICGKTVRIGITAPRHINIVRDDVKCIDARGRAGNCNGNCGNHGDRNVKMGKIPPISLRKTTEPAHIGEILPGVMASINLRMLAQDRAAKLLPGRILNISNSRLLDHKQLRGVI